MMTTIGATTVDVIIGGREPAMMTLPAAAGTGEG